MFYEFCDDVVGIELESVTDSSVVAGYICVDDVQRIAEYFSFSQYTVLQCQKNDHFRSNIDIYDDYIFGTLKIVNGDKEKFDGDCIAFYIKKNVMIIVSVYDRDCSVRDKFLNSLSRFSPQAISIEKIIFAFFENVINGDNRFIEDLEFNIDYLEEMVVKDKAGDNFNLLILKIKKQLLLLRNYYEQLIDIGDALADNENEIFEENELKYFLNFVKRVQRLLDNVDSLRDGINHLRDAYEASLELKLNKTMKVFTVFTVVFLPLTLITGWYGMNFAYMPELSWKYGYIFVICLSVSVISGLLLFFKKKKWI